MMSKEKQKHKISKHLEHELLDKNDADQLTDREREWIDYIVDHVVRFTGVVGEVKSRGRIYEMLANEWNKHICDVSDGMGLDLARDMLFDQLMAWIASGFSPDEAGSYIEAGADTPEEVRQKMNKEETT